MLSGRYRTDLLMSNWLTSNPDGLCRLPGCSGETGSLKHILLECSGLSAEARATALSHWSSFLVPRPWLLPVVAHHTLGGDQLNLQFLLDPSVLPMVISANKDNPETLPSCFYLARTWNFTIHLKREKIRKLWNLKNWLERFSKLGILWLPNKKAQKYVTSCNLKIIILVVLWQ